MSISTLYATLKRLDFSYQTCRPVHPFNDKAVMEAWKAQLPEKIKSVQCAMKGRQTLRVQVPSSKESRTMM